jgi:hypothetical protein
MYSVFRSHAGKKITASLKVIPLLFIARLCFYYQVRFCLLDRHIDLAEDNKMEYNIHIQVTLIYDIAALIKSHEVCVSSDFGYCHHKLVLSQANYVCMLS